MNTITDLAQQLAQQIVALGNPDEQISALNQVRGILHEISPLKHHPVDYVHWQKSEDVEENEYNPNVVAPPEMRLLLVSIKEDGFTMPVVTCPTEDTMKIVDGYHRRKSERIDKTIHESTFGYLPITFVREENRTIPRRMASTIRHNRARGTHNIHLMVNIVAELTEAGMGDHWIMRHIGMDADELLRLKQISGLAALFKNGNYSRAWE